MLETLIESNAPRQRRAVGTLASTGIHTAAVVGTVVATASAKPKPIRPQIPVLPRPAYVWPTQSSGAEPSPHRRDGTSGGPTPTRPIQPVTLHYLPKIGLDRLGEVDLLAVLTFDSLGPVGPIGRTRGSGSPVHGDQPRTAATVDRLAALLAPPRPRYPERLRATGVTGRVVVRLIVDTLGRVEPTSVAVRESRHDMFTQSVLATLPGLRFAPAEIGGRRVRMLVDLPFEFRLTR